MKKYSFIGLLALLIPTLAFAALNDGITKFPNDVNVNDQACIDIPLMTFSQETGHATSVPMAMGTGMAVLSASTAPGLEFDNGMVSLVWADTETSPVTALLKVPYNWKTGTKFRVTHTQSTGAVAAALDFDVRRVVVGTAAPTSITTAQDAVTLTPSSTSPQTATLTPATDLASLAAGNLVAFRLWRDDVNTSTEDVEVYKVEYCGPNPGN